jgi:hypothetical protein
MSRLAYLVEQEQKPEPALLFGDDEQYSQQDDYFDMVQEQAETEILRMGHGSRRTIVTDMDW